MSNNVVFLAWERVERELHSPLRQRMQIERRLVQQVPARRRNPPECSLDTQYEYKGMRRTLILHWPQKIWLPVYKKPSLSRLEQIKRYLVSGTDVASTPAVTGSVFNPKFWLFWHSPVYVHCTLYNIHYTIYIIHVTFSSH